MTGYEIGIMSVTAIVLLVYSGMHIPVVLALVSFFGTWLITDNFDISINLLAIKSAETIASQDFAVIPLFVLMGLLVSSSDIAREVFEVANHYLKKIVGGLGVATVLANAVFAAITGVSIASAAVFTRVAVPEMTRLGYSKRFSVGVVAGSSVLGMLIPPSILLVVYAFLVEQSVGALFLAAVIPGLLLTACFCVGILLVGRFMPSIVGGATAVEALATHNDEMSIMDVVHRLAPIFALVLLVIGGIYAGWFTPTEAGAVGAAGALVIVLAKRRLSLRDFWNVAVETGHITASICFLIISAGMYSSMLGLSGIPNELGSWVSQSGFGEWQLMLVFLVILLVLGTILDSISIMLITIPIFLPLFEPFNVDLVWLGIITVITVEIGLLTPPLGIAVYVIKSTLQDDEISLKDVFIGAAPFALIMLFLTVMIILFPSLTRLI